MNRTALTACLLGTATVACLAPHAAAQNYAILIFSTPCGGATSPIAAGPYTLQSTLGAPMGGGPVSAGRFSLDSGFLAASGGGPAPCYANCDGSTIPPILNVNDFICFQTKYAAADPSANCDGSTIPPVLNVNDFICFLTKYAQGCP